MADMPRSHLLAYVLALAAVLAFGARQLAHSGDSAASASVPIAVTRGTPVEGSGPRGGMLVVDVAGAVRRPGVYRLRAGARVADAVRLAGGATRRAELSGINRAAKLEDGRQVIVPLKAAAGAPAAAPGVPGAPGALAAPVNLNTATPEQLDTLDGIGPAMAKKILDYRTEHGGFSSIDELGEISGIGERRLASLREQVTL